MKNWKALHGRERAVRAIARQGGHLARLRTAPGPTRPTIPASLHGREYAKKNLFILFPSKRPYRFAA
jgi:hypothetical protein